MKYFTDPKTGNKVSVLGFGCMRFAGDNLVRSLAGKFNVQKAERLILEAYDKGINYYDTAYIYTGSEDFLGKTLEKHGLREKVYIATKMPLVMCRKAEDLDKFFNIQLKRLRTDYVDYYMMHMLSDMKTWETLCQWGIKEWIEEKKKTGQIKSLGFSFHGSQEEFLALLDAYDWDFCQIQYNYSDENYQAGVTGLKAAADKGIPVIIMEPLLGGKLTKKLPKEAISRFKNAKTKMSPAGWALSWLYNQPEVSWILSGMNEMEQLEDNLAIADKAEPGILSQEDLGVIADVKGIFDAAYRVHCTGCHYCTPCPVGINIPACFTAYNTRHAINKSQGWVQYCMSTLTGDKPTNAGLCIKCGKCETHCPQNIAIRDELEAVSRDMEGPLFQVVKRLAPIFMRKKKKENI
ncbi:MAG: aldo/keto reductase [Bacillota bacterium]|nr:aldo/keto reductase [Bacillota bacterium]